MASLFFLILFLSAIVGIYYHTRHISSIKKRMTLTIGIPLLLCYMLFFKPWTATIFTPLYCLAHSNTNIKEYIKPEDWKNKHITIDALKLNEFRVLEPEYSVFSYPEELQIDNINYEATFFNQSIPSLVIYMSYNNKLFGKYAYLYYDASISKPIISIEEYVSEYRGFSGDNNVSSCNDDALSDLRSYFIENYLNRQ